jgi:hypothetical protein
VPVGVYLLTAAQIYVILTGGAHTKTQLQEKAAEATKQKEERRKKTF